MSTRTSCQWENIGVPQMITVFIGDTPGLRVGSTHKDLTGSSKHGRDKGSGDESPPSKVARGDQDGADAEVQCTESSSAPLSCTASGLQTIVSELSGEIKELKGQVVTLLGDVAMVSDSITRNAAMDFVCKHCCGRGLGDEGKQGSVEKWRYELDSLEEESQIPYPCPSRTL